MRRVTRSTFSLSVGEMWKERPRRSLKSSSMKAARGTLLKATAMGSPTRSSPRLSTAPSAMPGPPGTPGAGVITRVPCPLSTVSVSASATSAGRVGERMGSGRGATWKVEQPPASTETANASETAAASARRAGPDKGGDRGCAGGHPAGGRTAGGRTAGGRTVGGHAVGGRTVGGHAVVCRGGGVLVTATSTLLVSGRLEPGRDRVSWLAGPGSAGRRRRGRDRRRRVPAGHRPLATRRRRSTEGTIPALRARRLRPPG